MDSIVLDFFSKYPVMTVSVLGSILGTILSYIAPGFTYDYLSAKEDFGPGNLGLTVFVHANWGHLIGNLMIMFAPSIICQKKYGCKSIFILLAVFALYTGLVCIPCKRGSVGFSGCAYMMLAMACVYGHHIWGYILLVYFFIISCISDIGTRSNKLNHISGYVFGTAAGLLLQ